MRQTTRRQFVQSVAIAGTASMLAGPSLARADASPSNTTKKNVLFIAVDDLRPQLGCYGHKQMLSPHIDKLAASGMQFERAYCQVPVCGASRASLMTGLRPSPKRFLNYSTWKDKDAPDAVSVAGLFKANGYTTLSRGKIYHHRKDDANAWSESAWKPSGIRQYRTDEAHKMAHSNLDRRGRPRGPASESSESADSDHADGQIADQLIKDLADVKKSGKPWFLAGGFP